MTKKQNKFISFLAGIISKIGIKSLDKDKKTNLEFTSSSQKIGIVFTDKIRHIFRNKWINKK